MRHGRKGPDLEALKKNALRVPRIAAVGPAHRLRVQEVSASPEEVHAVRNSCRVLGPVGDRNTKASPVLEMYACTELTVEVPAKIRMDACVVLGWACWVCSASTDQ